MPENAAAVPEKRTLRYSLRELSLTGVKLSLEVGDLCIFLSNGRIGCIQLILKVRYL